MEVERFDRPTTRPTRTDRVPIVRADDVLKIFRGAEVDTVALRGVSLTIHTGEFVALLGRSGSGKSTLLHLIAGLDVPSAGRIFIDGHDISRLHEEGRAAVRAERMGVILQRDNLIPYLTAAENVALPLQLSGMPAARARACELLARVGLKSRADHRANHLSGGEQQRVGIAVALAREPHLLLGDEVTGELDSESSEGVMDLLIDLKRREHMALLLVTHDPTIAERAERVLVMQDGVVEPHE